MIAADCPVIADLIEHANLAYNYFQPNRGIFLIHKLGTDTLIYFNTIENKKRISLLPFKPSRTEFHWRSRLVVANDTLFYLTGHHSGFYKLRFNPASGAIKFYPEKYFDSYMV